MRVNFLTNKIDRFLVIKYVLKKCECELLFKTMGNKGKQKNLLIKKK